MTVLDAYLEPFAACLTPEVARRISELRPDSRTEKRLEYLRQAANEGTLSESERAKYQEFVETLDVVAVLKAKARAVLEATAS